MEDTIGFININRPFLLNIHLTAINLVADHGAQVLQPVHPRERVATEVHAGKISGFGQESHAFGFTKLGIRVRGEFQIMRVCIFLACFQNVL